METPQLVIIERRKLEQLAFWAQYWWAGWVTASLALIVMACMLVAALRVARDIRDQRVMIEDLNQRQQQVTSAQIAAWQNQETAIRTITAWGEYVKNRSELSAENGPALPSAPQRQSRLAGK